MKLIIDKLYVRNFKSFGDDEYIIDLLKRGPILISGKNGSGKSTMVEAIIWCLFGKLSDNPNPGDTIVNWNSGKNCMVKINTVDGYEICRTRKYEGKSDLLILKNGTPIDDGDSTNTNAQITLNKLFKLDFNTWVANMFFGQASGSFLSMTDTKKKLVIENMFGLSKLSYYSRVAKERINKCNETYQSIKLKIADIESIINATKDEITKYESLSKEFEEEKAITIQNHQLEIKKLQDNQSELISVDNLKESWSLINKSEQKIKEFEEIKETLVSQFKKIIDDIASSNRLKIKHNDDITIANRNIKHIESKYAEIEDQKGQVCPTCEQLIPEEYINNKVKTAKEKDTDEINKYNKSIDNAKSEIINVNVNIVSFEKEKDDVQNKISKINDNIKKLQISINKTKTGKITLIEATRHNEIINNINRTIKERQNLIIEEKNKKNNYIDLSVTATRKIKTHTDQIIALKHNSETIALEASHLTFIYRAHSDKKNLRSFLISGSIPILNNRLSYYFNELNIYTDIEFNSILQIKSNRWPYSTHSGGEKKRIDLALMCALYDTFVSMYGQKSNILVLDEIDKEFDKEGVDEYVRLIVDDLSSRIDTILIISHKNEINYAFPTQIKLTKENDVSKLEQS